MDLILIDDKVINLNHIAFTERATDRTGRKTISVLLHFPDGAERVLDGDQAERFWDAVEQRAEVLPKPPQ